MASAVQVLNKVKRDNLFKGLKLELFEIIARNPNLTIGEIWEKYVGMHPDAYRSRNELAKRVSDLASLGLVKTKSRVLCPVSGRKAYRWVASGSTPQFELDDAGRKKLVNRKVFKKSKTVQLAPEPTPTPQSEPVTASPETLLVLESLLKKRQKDRSLYSFFFNRPKKDLEIAALKEAIIRLGGKV